MSHSSPQMQRLEDAIASGDQALLRKEIEAVKGVPGIKAHRKRAQRRLAEISKCQAGAALNLEQCALPADVQATASSGCNGDEGVVDFDQPGSCPHFLIWSFGDGGEAYASIHPAISGWIIGERGSTLQGLKDQTGTSLFLEPSNWKLVMRGENVDVCRKAAVLIEQHIRQAPFYVSSLQTRSNTFFTRTLQIPEALIGSVFEQKSKFRQESGCDILINGTCYTCSMSGSESSVNKAIDLVQAFARERLGTDCVFAPTLAQVAARHALEIGVVSPQPPQQLVVQQQQQQQQQQKEQRRRQEQQQQQQQHQPSGLITTEAQAGSSSTSSSTSSRERRGSWANVASSTPASSATAGSIPAHVGVIGEAKEQQKQQQLVVQAVLDEDDSWNHDFARLAASSNVIAPRSSPYTHQQEHEQQQQQQQQHQEHHQERLRQHHHQQHVLQIQRQQLQRQQQHHHQQQQYHLEPVYPNMTSEATTTPPLPGLARNTHTSSSHTHNMNHLPITGETSSSMSVLPFTAPTPPNGGRGDGGGATTTPSPSYYGMGHGSNGTTPSAVSTIGTTSPASSAVSSPLYYRGNEEEEGGEEGCGSGAGGIGVGSTARQLSNLDLSDHTGFGGVGSGGVLLRLVYEEEPEQEEEQEQQQQHHQQQQGLGPEEEEEVRQFMESLKLGKWLPVLEASGLSMAQLSVVSEADLTQMGLKKGQRVKLLKALEERNNNNSN